VACDGPMPDFSLRAIDGAALGQGLPSTFLFGAASAAHQIEGGEHNDWTEWEPGSFPDGSPHVLNHDTSQIADGSWTRWPQDVAALQQLGANAYRLSVEWSRLEPTEGAWDSTAEANYRAQLQALRAHGITPVLTIHHYTFPLWVAHQGGWEWAGVTDALGAFAGRVGQHFGDLVDIYCTINEPNFGGTAAYLWGNYPPGVQDPARFARVYVTMLHAHVAMTQALRAQDTTDADGDGRATFIGLTSTADIFEPATSSAQDAMLTQLVDDVFNEVVPRAVKTGRAKVYFPGLVDIDEEVPGIQGTFDYLGLNYYTRRMVRFDLSQDTFADEYFLPNRPASDLGYEVYPQGLYRMLKREARWGWPIFIMENGIADATGNQRPGYLRSHLYAMEQAMKDGVDVRGYLHWSLDDNFEWASGYSGRLGLFRVDVNDPDLVRTPTPAVATFRQIALEAGLAPDR